MAEEKKEPKKCQQCGKNPALELHPCPYKQEINGDSELCDCCDLCRDQCLEDI